MSLNPHSRPVIPTRQMGILRLRLLKLLTVTRLVAVHQLESRAPSPDLALPASLADESESHRPATAVPVGLTPPRKNENFIVSL